MNHERYDMTTRGTKITKNAKLPDTQHALQASKGMVAEFKEFISRGSVIDLAVGIIIGGAFTAIVKSLVDDIIMPVVGMALGGINFSGLALNIGKAQLTYGNFIQAVLNFLIIAFVVFMMIKLINKARRIKKADEAAEAVEAPTPEDIALLREIRDALKKD